MEEALRFFKAYEVWVYLLLGLGGLIYVRKFILAWQELRGAAFGLERESAQARLNLAASALVLLLTLAMSEFVMVSFIAPTVPEASPLLTPTLDLLATPTIALEPSAQVVGVLPITNTITPTLTVAGDDGCIPGQIAISSPANGDEISGAVEIKGTANILDFGFYKLEMRTPDQSSWLTILAGDGVKQDETLGTWNTSLLSPGNYQLSLVVTDNQGKILPACIVQVRITAPTPTPQP